MRLGRDYTGGKHGGASGGVQICRAILEKQKKNMGDGTANGGIRKKTRVKVAEGEKRDGNQFSGFHREV